jgi:AcrR family transcriptional regulator
MVGACRVFAGIDIMHQQLLYNIVSEKVCGAVTINPSKKSRNNQDRPRTHPAINDYRRRALMEGTIQSMAENGVAFTTIQTISTAAEASRGLIAHYFGSKEVLVSEAFKYLFRSVSAQVSERVIASGAQTANERLKAVPEALFSAKIFTKRNRDAFLSFWHEVRFNTLMRKANEELYQAYIQNMETLFADAAAEKDVVIDPHRAALGLIALSDGLWLGLSIHGQSLSPTEAIELCQRYIEERLGSS